MPKEEIHYLNIADILKQKAPNLAKKLPKFVVRLAERIIYQKRLNQYIDYVHKTRGVEYFKKIMEFSRIKVEVSGFEEIEANKGYIFVSNHPLGGLDGIALISVIGDKFPEIRAFVNDILMSMKYADPVFIPVNKHGANSKAYAQKGEEAYNTGKPILIFPSGLVSRKQKGVVCDPEWKRNFIKKAIEKKRDVVPVYFHGKNSRLFYFVSRIRKFLGIKFNIEMILLSHEVMIKEGKTFKISFGKPISHTRFDKNEKPLNEWATTVQKETYAMGGVDISKINLKNLI